MDKNHGRVSRFKHLAGHAAVDPMTDSSAPMGAQDDVVDGISLSKIQNHVCWIDA